MGRCVRIGIQGDATSAKQVEVLAEEIRQLHPHFTTETVGIAGRKTTKQPRFDQCTDLLRSNLAELAICEMEDVPLEVPPDIVLAAVTTRNTPFEALVSLESRILDDFPPGAKLGVNRHHRKLQFLAYRKDIKICDCRGGIEHCWRKLSKGAYDGFVVAASHMEWLGWQHRLTEIFTPEVCLPQAGQGSLGIFVRKGDSASAAVAKEFNDSSSKLEIEAERKFLSTLLPQFLPTAAVLGRIEGELFKLEAVVADPGEETLYKANSKGRAEDTGEVVSILVNKLLDAGARDLLSPSFIE